MKENTTQSVKSSTLKELSDTEFSLVDHITDKLIAEYSDAELPPQAEDESAIATTFYGHDMAYIFSQRYQKYGYAYRGSANSRERSCGNTHGWFLPHDKWNHTKVGNCGSNNNALLRFTKR